MYYITNIIHYVVLHTLLPIIIGINTLPIMGHKGSPKDLVPLIMDPIWIPGVDHPHGFLFYVSRILRIPGA